MTKKLFCVLLAVVISVSLLYGCASDGINATDLDGKTVILHTNDVHGSIEGYAKLASLKAEYEKKGAEVILADAGDFSQGNAYVSTSKGSDAVTVMNAAGYDIVCPGNHEFDYGYDTLMKNFEDSDFTAVCCNIDYNGEAAFEPYYVYTTGSGLKIAFIGVDTPELQTKVNPAMIKGISVLTGEALFSEFISCSEKAKNDGADLIIALTHLGIDVGSEENTSDYFYSKTKDYVDFIIDGHSHTVMEKGKKGEPIQSTGTAFEKIGVIVIDENGEIEKNYLVSSKKLKEDAAVLSEAQKIIDKVDAEYGVVFAKSDVELNGDKSRSGNRDSETNLGDFITDAILWYVQNEFDISAIDKDHVVAVINGGGIRDWIHKGDVTKKDIHNAFPFGNNLSVVYLTGAELLEAIEASTFCTPKAVGGFPQVSGISYTVRTGVPYDSGELYPSSTYHAPKSIQRVTVDSVNGKPFDENAQYAVVTNDFCASGGDTYYRFSASEKSFDTAELIDDAVISYISNALGGTIGEEYAKPMGRINITRH